MTAWWNPGQLTPAEEAASGSFADARRTVGRTAAGDWTEELHPRAEHGRFGSKGTAVLDRPDLPTGGKHAAWMSAIQPALDRLISQHPDDTHAAALFALDGLPPGLDGAASLEARQRSGDRSLGALAHEQGFDVNPEVGDGARLEEVKAAGGLEVWRGVSGADAAGYAAQFRDGEYFPGRGVYGNGTYATGIESMAKSYAVGDGYGDRFGGILHMVVQPDAKIAPNSEWIQDAYDQMMTRVTADRGFEGSQGMRRLFMDPGRMATALGYDAMWSAHGGELVILNRVAVVVEAARPAGEAEAEAKARGDAVTEKLRQRAEAMGLKPIATTAAMLATLKGSLGVAASIDPAEIVRDDHGRFATKGGGVEKGDAATAFDAYPGGVTALTAKVEDEIRTELMRIDGTVSVLTRYTGPRLAASSDPEQRRVEEAVAALGLTPSGPGDPVLGAMQHARGFDGPTQLVDDVGSLRAIGAQGFTDVVASATRADREANPNDDRVGYQVRVFTENAAAAGDQLMFRGVSDAPFRLSAPRGDAATIDPTPESTSAAVGYVNEWKGGDLYPGVGFHGGGTYFAAFTPDLTLRYANQLPTNPPSVSVIVSAPNPGFKAVGEETSTGSRGGSSYARAMVKVADDPATPPDTSAALRERANVIDTITSDAGRYAVYHGYDGMIAASFGHYPEVIVLNRTATSTLDGLPSITKTADGVASVISVVPSADAAALAHAASVSPVAKTSIGPAA